MKRIKVLVFSMLAAMMLASCGTTQKVPLTGRTHRISVSDAQVLSLSNQEYTKYMLRLRNLPMQRRLRRW